MPVDLPNFGYSGLDLLPDSGIAFARSEAGLIISSRRGDPFWSGTLTSAELEFEDRADLVAFLSRAVDLNLLVDFVHPLYPFPSAYGASTWPMGGDANLEAVTDLRNIVVSGLVTDMVLRRGDRLSIVQDSLIAHRWIAANVTVTSESSQTLELTPRLPVGVFLADATVVLASPKMRLRVVPKSWSAPESASASAVSFGVEEALSS